MKPVLRKDAIFGFHTDLHAHQDDTVLWADLTEEMAENFLEVVKPDYFQFDCKGHYGYTSYHTQIGYASPGITKDALAIWRKATRKHGVGLFVHYSGVWDWAVLQRHPEWAAKQADGTYNNIATSTFSPYVEEFLIPQLKEVITRYDIDGIWIDGDCWGAVVDYSDKAIEEFTKATGITDIPKSPDEPHWKEFLKFQREQFKRYVTKYLDALHEFKPGIQITSNWMYTTFIPEAVTVPIDYISGDYSGTEAINTARLEARYLSSTGMPWDLMAWSGAKGPRQRNWNWKSPQQLEQEASVVLSQGGGWQVVYQGTRSGYLNNGVTNTLKEVGSFIRERQALCHKTTAVPQVALLLSETSIQDRNNSIYSNPYEESRTILGVLHGLLDLQYSVDVKAEHQLAGHLSEYPAIVVPDWHMLPDSLVTEMKEYVKNGGHLFLAGPQAASYFVDELGVKFDTPLTNLAKDLEDFEKNVLLPGLMFLHPDFKEIDVEMNGIIAAAGDFFRKVKVDGAEIISYCYPDRIFPRDAMVFSTINKCGKGTIAASYASMGDSYLESHTYVMRNEFKKIMSKVFPNPKVEVTAPPAVDVSLRQKDGKLQVHLLNISGMQVAPTYAVIDYIAPVHNIKLKVRLDKEPKNVEWAYGGKTISRTYENGILNLELDVLKIHDVLVIE